MSKWHFLWEGWWECSYVNEKNQSDKSTCIKREGWNCQHVTRKGSYHIHSKLPERVLVSKELQRLIITFSYPKMASKLAYSRPISWVSELGFFEDSSYHNKSLIKF